SAARRRRGASPAAPRPPRTARPRADTRPAVGSVGPPRPWGVYQPLVPPRAGPAWHRSAGAGVGYGGQGIASAATDGSGGRGPDAGTAGGRLLPGAPGGAPVLGHRLRRARLRRRGARPQPRGRRAAADAVRRDRRRAGDG